MMERSIFLYELVKSMIETKSVVNTAPHIIGISKSISNAMAPPRISAKEVEIDASTAVPRIGRDTHLGVYLVAASERQTSGNNPQVGNVVLKHNQHNSGQCNHPK